MGIADDLPTLADRLANPAPGDPEQACLRRAISTAYYALFHLLVQEAVQGWSGSPATLPWAGENPRPPKHAGGVRNQLPGFLERVGHPADFRVCRTKGCREDVLRLARVAPRGGLRQYQDLDRRAAKSHAPELLFRTGRKSGPIPRRTSICCRFWSARSGNEPAKPPPPYSLSISLTSRSAPYNLRSASVMPAVCTATARLAVPSYTKSPTNDSMLPSKISPTMSAFRLITGIVGLIFDGNIE